MLLTLLVLTATLDVTGVVYLDANANGRRDPGEAGLPGVVVSDQVAVVRTGPDGAFRIADSRGFGLVFVSVPDGYRSVGPFWRPVGGGRIELGLAPVSVRAELVFVHASDTHISPASRARTTAFRAAVDSIRPDFVIVTGDLVRDALRVPEAEATGYYRLFEEEARQLSMPLWTVPGNHEIFGVEREKSGVRPDHPLYGRAMYRHFRGPDYYSFTAGGVHFVGLNSVDVDDMWYYGHVDSVQMRWLERDLATIPATMPVVTFNHIPFFTAVETVNGYMDGPPAPTVITVAGRSQFRHTVSNAAAVLGLIGVARLPLALGGHMHVREQIRYQGVPTRFYQTAAVVGPSDGAGLALPSGVTVYRIRNGAIDDGTFVPLPVPRPAP